MMRWEGLVPVGPLVLFLGAWFTGWWLRRHPDYCEYHGDICPRNYRCWRWADGECDGQERRAVDATH